MEALATRALSLRALGTMGAALDGHEVPLSSRKALAILIYLALQPSHSESRERIAALLWSDSAGEQGRGALRQTLRRLKLDLGLPDEVVTGDRTMLRLALPVRLDIVEAIEAAGRGEAPDLPGTDEDGGLSRLFADLEDLDPDFNLWIAVQRERLRAQLVDRLEKALDRAGTPQRSLALAEALTRTDATHEGACRAAMTAHLELGDTAHAMRAYDRLWKTLDDELEVEPSERTQALYVAIKQGRAVTPAHAAPVAPASAPPAPEPPVEPDVAPVAIVVEPVQARFLPGEHGFFAQIFRDEMITAMTRFRDWLIIDGEDGTTMPPTYRAYALRITLHGQQDSVMVGLRLVDHADSHGIWAERYTATLDGMTTLHRTAIRNLAVALDVHLSGPRQQAVIGARGPLGRRYEMWMLAQALMSEWRPQDEARAEAILRDLVAQHPDFAPAMVALSQLLNAHPVIYPGKRRQQERVDESLGLSARAVKLDPLDCRAHLCRAWSHLMADAYSPALSHLDLALDLNENDPWTIISAGLGFAFGDVGDQARDLMRQARAFNMRHSRAAQGYVATGCYLVGDFEQAVASAELAGDAIVNLPAWQAASLIELGDMDGAAAAVARFLRLARGGWTGQTPATEQAILDWFMGCFPVRNGDVRARLAANLDAALAAAKKRRLD